MHMHLPTMLQIVKRVSNVVWADHYMSETSGVFSNDYANIERVQAVHREV